MRWVKGAWAWVDDRTGFSTLVTPILVHPVPRGAGWAYVFGSATLFAFIIQVITGIALSTAFVTSAGDAYESLQFITASPLGYLLRGMHFYGASAMILMVGLHMIQVYLFGAFKYPREMNWLSGVILLAVTVAMGFTGQLLRWDDIAVWSVFVAASQSSRVPLVGEQVARFIIAGDSIGGATLSRFYAFHVFFIPALIFAVVGLHLWLVLHHGISEPPKAGRPIDPKTYRAWYHQYLERDGVPFWPDAAWRDIVFGVGMLIVIMLLSWFWGPPPLGEPPDPSAIETYPRPDWYFLWFFAALALLPHQIEDYVIILGPLVIGFLLFALPFFSNRGERSWKRRPWAVGIVLTVVIMIGTLWIVGVQAPWSPNFEAETLASDVVPAGTEQVRQGAQLFHDEGCIYCHAYANQGGQRGPNLSNVSERLPPEQIGIAILDGREGMPSYATTLSPQEVEALVAFLRAQGAGEEAGANGPTRKP
jgi:ubiquinol-cytochrome c reductase cytochrome b subunit